MCTEFRNFDVFLYNNDTFFDFLVYLFDNRNFSGLGVDKSNYLKFTKTLKDKYLCNPYHNFSHAVDAVFTLNFFLTFLKEQLTLIEIFSLLMSMLCHDVGHFGRTGRYVSEYIKTFVEKYGQDSPLEQFHLSEAKAIIDDTNLLLGMSDDDKGKFYNIFDRCILATDPANSKKFLESFNGTMLFELLMKCADIGNSLKSFNIHEKWVMKIMEEFYSEGKVIKLTEKLQPLFNENMKHEIPQQQVGFCNFYTKPHFQKLSIYLTNGDEILKFVEENENVWKSKIII